MSCLLNIDLDLCPMSRRKKKVSCLFLVFFWGGIRLPKDSLSKTQVDNGALSDSSAASALGTSAKGGTDLGFASRTAGVCHPSVFVL